MISLQRFLSPWINITNRWGNKFYIKWRNYNPLNWKSDIVDDCSNKAYLTLYLYQIMYTNFWSVCVEHDKYKCFCVILSRDPCCDVNNTRLGMFKVNIKYYPISNATITHKRIFHTFCIFPRQIILSVHTQR